MAATPQDHARFSPSGASKWMNCPGALALEKGLKDTSSKYAEEGTAAHELAAWVLQDKHPDAWCFENAPIRIINGKYKSPEALKNFKDPIITDNTFIVDQSMIEYVNEYVDNIRLYSSLPGAVTFIEHRVDFSHIVGVPGQFGTSDAIIVTPNELIICDLKYGMGVPVHAENNKQLMIYALGALDIARMFYDVQRVRLVIHQPRIENLSEWDLSVEDLEAFGKGVGIAAQVAKSIMDETDIEKIMPHLNPGESQCRWCKAKATCPALERKIADEVLGDFLEMAEVEKMEDDVLLASIEHAKEVVVKRAPSDILARHLKAVPLIEMWCKSVRETTYMRLMEGEQVPGFKIVEGRKGNRAWVNTEMVAELIGDREEMWTKALKGPAAVEKLLKDDKDLWKNEVSKLITQSPGKPSVAPESDKRPAIDPRESGVDFDDITEGDFDDI